MKDDHLVEFLTPFMVFIVVGAYIKYPPEGLVLFGHALAHFFTKLGLLLLLGLKIGLAVFLLWQLMNLIFGAMDMFKTYKYINSCFPQLVKDLGDAKDQVAKLEGRVDRLSYYSDDLEAQIKKLKKKIEDLEAPTSSVVTAAITELQGGSN